MVSYKTKIKYLMYRLKLRQTIPAAFINEIRIEDNKEPLVNIRDDSCFAFGPTLLRQKEVFLRQSVAEKLKAAAQKLPDGVKFKIYSAYRSIELQKQMCLRLNIKTSDLI